MCDHTGTYTVDSRLYGYTPVRKYHCEMCGASMAMDTLPKHLLRQMYGYLVRGPLPIKPLPPVDLCFIVGGPTAVPLARICFNSLARTLATLEGVKVHLINTDLSAREFSQIWSMFPRCSVATRPPVPSGSKVLGDDTEWSCEWTVRNCGKNEHVILCHFDLFFTQDFLNYTRSLITEKTGMLGQHCPFMLLKRRALAETRLRFASTPAPFYAVPRDDVTGQFFLYCGDDRRVPTNAMRGGFDLGELLELEMRARGWETDALREVHDDYFYHFSGGARVTDGPELDSIRRRVKMFTEVYDLNQDPARMLEELY